MRGMVENYCAEVKLNPGLLFTGARNSPKKGQSIFVLYTPFIDIFSPYRTRKIWKVGYRVPNSAAVTASSRVREIVKTNTHGLVSKHEHCRK